MANVTYLLGAGASYHALPVVEKFEEEIQKVSQRLLNQIGIPSSDKHSEKNSAFNRAINDLQFLLQGCKDHASVDTFARMYYLTEKTSLYQKVKCAIILFFELHYFFFREVDKRYDAFLAGILRIQPPRLPAYINIISWNYDYEIERAYMKYMPGVLSAEQAYKEMQVHHKGNSVDNKEGVFHLVKLNGTSGYFNDEYDYKISLGLGIDSHLIYDKWEAKPENFSVLDSLLERHMKNNYGIGTDMASAISFAWEERERNNVVNQASEILKNSESLVIIGYSFPYFNRVVDKELFNEGRFPNGALRNIYVQDPDAKNIIESIKSMIPNEWHNEMKFISISNLKQFYMPYEMD